MLILLINLINPYKYNNDTYTLELKNNSYTFTNANNTIFTGKKIDDQYYFTAMKNNSIGDIQYTTIEKQYTTTTNETKTTDINIPIYRCLQYNTFFYYPFLYAISFVFQEDS